MELSFKIEDKKLNAFLESSLTNTLNSMMTSYFKKIDLLSMVRQEGKSRISKYYERSYQDGSFIQMLTKHVATEVAKDIDITKIREMIDMNELKEMVANKIADRILTNQK